MEHTALDGITGFAGIVFALFVVIIMFAALGPWAIGLPLLMGLEFIQSLWGTRRK